MSFTVTRYHDISCGHRVTGHDGPCRFLHGHNYRFHFTCEPDGCSRGKGAQLDRLGRVIDFGLIKRLLCAWLEENWDHRFLVWKEDPQASALQTLDSTVVKLPFNPTAENLARYMVEMVGPDLLAEHGVRLTKVVVEETAKCSATYEKEPK